MAEDDSDKGGTDVLERPTTSAPTPSWLPSAAAPADTSNPWGSAKPPEKSLEDLTRPPQAILDLQKQRTQDTESLRREQSGIISQDQAETHRRFAQTGIEPGTLEPWDNNKQREKYRTDPIESFGSLGSVFAIVASAFTRAPMENALNGAAAAMNAIRAGNEKEFELAHRSWKENNDLALKRHDIMQQQYQNAIQLMSSDVTAGRAKIEMLAASYGDQQLTALMEAGLWPQGLELMERRQKVAEGVREASLRNEKDQFQRVAFKAAKEKNAQQYPDPSQRAAYDLFEFNKIYGAKEQTPQHALFAQHMLENPGEKADDSVKWAQKNGMLPRQYYGGMQQAQLETYNSLVQKYTSDPYNMDPAEAQRRALDETAKAMARPSGASGGSAAANRTRTAEEAISEFEKTGERLSADEKNLIHKAHEDKTSAGLSKALAVTAHLDEMRKRKENGENVNAAERLADLQKRLDGHDDQEEAVAISQYRQKPFTGWAAASGRGAKIMSQVHQLNPDYDEKTWNSTSAISKVGSTAPVLALSSSLKQLEGMRAAVESFERAERPNLKLLVELGEKADATGIPALERWIRAGRQATGDEDVQRFHTQYAVTMPGVARIITQPRLVGQLTDAARKEIQEGIPYASSAAQLRASADILFGDMDRRKKGLEDQIDRTNQRIKETMSSGGSSPTGRRSETLPERALSMLKEGTETKFNNGQVWTLRDGKPERVR